MKTRTSFDFNFNVLEPQANYVHTPGTYYYLSYLDVHCLTQAVDQIVQCHDAICFDTCDQRPRRIH